MIDPAILEDYLKAACSGHNRRYDDSKLTFWLSCTGSVTTAQFEEVFWECAISDVPKPIDLIHKIMGINSHDDWESIMGVSQGRYESKEISGYAAAALQSIGGINAVAIAKNESSNGYSELDRLHQRFLKGLETSGSGLPAAPVIITLHGAKLSPSQRLDGETYEDSTGAIVRKDYSDVSGRDRADSLIRLLRAGSIKTSSAKKMIDGTCKMGNAAIKTESMKPIHRDRVYAVIAEIEEKDVFDIDNNFASTPLIKDTRSLELEIMSQLNNNGAA